MEQAKTAQRPEEAEKHFKAAIREAQHAGGKDLRLAESLDGLALLYRDQKKFSKSEALYQQSLSVKEAVLGPWDLSVAATLDDLASVITSQGKSDQAQPYDKRAHEIRDRALATHPDVYLNGVRKDVVPPK